MRHEAIDERSLKESAFARVLGRWMRGLWMVLAVSIPLSVKVYVVPLNLEIIFPAEPLLALLAALVAIAWWLAREQLFPDPAVLRHPIVLLALGWCAASLLSMSFSSLPLVSMKAMAVRIVYVLLFFLVPVCAGPLFRVDLLKLYGLHAAAFLGVLIYSLVDQLPSGLQRGNGVHASFPFYIDRTIYAAALVFVLVPVLVMGVRSFRDKAAWWRTSLWGVAGGLLLVGCYATFCRAAWLSVLIALPAGALLMIGLRWKGLLISMVMAVVLIAITARHVAQEALVPMVDSNADNAGWKEAVLSIPNITTDASNKERINRWFCAARMFGERPLLGFGPGTYQFEYIPYQKESWLTYLSWTESSDPAATLTSAWRMGDVMVKSPDQLYYYCGGTAHSEYLLALAETGTPGFLFLIALVGMTFTIGLRRIDHPALSGERYVLMAALLALLAYAVHAVFNNFLDDCKVAFLFWGAIAWVVRADLRVRINSSAPFPRSHPAGSA